MSWAIIICSLSGKEMYAIGYVDERDWGGRCGYLTSLPMILFLVWQQYGITVF